MKFAFLIMGSCFDASRDEAEICGGTARIVGVRDLAQACETAARLEKEGIGCIEVCGAFGKAGAEAVIEATGNRIPVGYVTHVSEQDDVFARAFGA